MKQGTHHEVTAIKSARRESQCRSNDAVGVQCDVAASQYSPQMARPPGSAITFQHGFFQSADMLLRVQYRVEGEARLGRCCVEVGLRHSSVVIYIYVILLE